jgi:branched-chain amino acid aminotransferase
MNNTTPLELLEGYIWFDGKFLDWKDAKIHVLTHSLHYSGSIFEGQKAVAGKVFKIEAHTDRLFRSASVMDLDIKFSKQEIINATYELLNKNNLADCYIRPLVWRSTHSLMVRQVDSVTHVMIACWKPRRGQAKKEFNINITQWIKPTDKMHPVQCKASSQYAIYSKIVMEAVKLGFDDSIMLDINGFISECTTSNLFFIKNSEIHTPTTDNCLNGITRQTVLDIASQNNIKSYERNITPAEIAGFDSCFITGTSSGIKEVNSIALGVNEVINFSENSYNNLLVK